MRADELGRMAVLDEHGQHRRLETLWQDRPAVLAFVRHFG
jgi:hypothetical protein